MNIQTSDGLDLFYETAGDQNRPPVLLLHGLGADHQMWCPQLASFPASGFFVIAPDMRGHGRSAAPASFSLADCARDMSELLASLRVPRAGIVGVSMGGLIAQQLACDHAACVDRLVIVDSFSGVASAMERLNGWLASVLLAVLPARWQTALLTTTYSRMGKADVAAYFEAQQDRLDPDRLREMRRAVNAFDIVGRLGEIRAPTLVLVGDGFGKTAIRMAQKTAQGIPGAGFRVLPGGGDPSNLLAPEVFDQAVLHFLQGTET